MKEFKCKNCNSTDFEYKGGIWVCNSCGSKFLPEKGEKPEKSREEKLVEKLAKEMDDLAEEILKINDKNPYALATMAFHIQNWGIKTEDVAERYLSQVEEAVECSTEESREFIYDTCGFSIHGMKAIAENNPGFMDRIEKLHKTFKEWGVVLI